MTARRAEKSSAEPHPARTTASIVDADQAVSAATTATAAHAVAAAGPGQESRRDARRDSLVDLDDVLSLAHSSVVDMDQMFDVAQTVPQWEQSKRGQSDGNGDEKSGQAQPADGGHEGDEENAVVASRGMGPWGGGDPRKQAERHPNHLNYYLHSGEMMRYKWVYIACPPVWLFVGYFYKYLDTVAGVMFVIGSLGFWFLPFWLYYGIWSFELNTILFIVSVSLFLLAKVFLELRALYAAMWKRANKRQSFHYHHALFWLIIGGITFDLILIFDLSPAAEKYAKTDGYLAFVSGVGFFLGTWIFTYDGYKLLKPGLFTNIENQYFWGSAALAVGGLLFLITGFCSTGIAVKYGPQYEGHMQFKDDTFCSDKFIRWANGVGGFFFEVGSISFLVFAAHESKDMENGPDPRTVGYHGHEEAHPMHHERHHLFQQ